jgi:hypothetical protein
MYGEWKSGLAKEGERERRGGEKRRENSLAFMGYSNREEGQVGDMNKH